MTERSARALAAPESGDLETAAQGDKLELRVWLRLLTCANLGGAALRRRLRERFDTTLPRFDVLAQLARSAEGLAMGELSKRLMVTNGNATGLVARLAADGLVTRAPAAHDRRRQTVRLTPAGRREFKAIAAAHDTWMADLTADLSRADKDALFGLLGALKSSFKNQSQRRRA